MVNKCILILRYPRFDNLCKTPLHRHKFSEWCTVSEWFLFHQVLFFSCVRLISFIISVVSAKMIRSYEALFDISFRSRKEIRISPQAWFQAANGLCLAEFKQWLPGQMGDKFSPIFRSLRLAARHDTAPARNCVLIAGKRLLSFCLLSPSPFYIPLLLLYSQLFLWTRAETLVTQVNVIRHSQLQFWAEV